MLAKTKIDSKGRISIPYHFRTSLGIDDFSHMKIEATEREMFLSPSVNGVKVKIRFRNFPSLLRTVRMISGSKVNIASNRLMNFDKRNIEWSAVLEGDTGILRNLVSRIKKSGGTKSVAVSQ